MGTQIVAKLCLSLPKTPCPSRKLYPGRKLKKTENRNGQDIGLTSQSAEFLGVSEPFIDSFLRSAQTRGDGVESC